MTTKATSGYSIAGREDALDFMAQYPGYGEQRWYSDSLGTEQVSFSWRRMLPGTGGRGSCGHRHPGQEELYFVIAVVGDERFVALEFESRSAEAYARSWKSRVRPA